MFLITCIFTQRFAISINASRFPLKMELKVFCTVYATISENKNCTF